MNHPPKLVYVAGPYRGPDAWIIENNIRRAEELAFEVWASNLYAICPHANTRHYQGALPDAVWLEGDLEILARCDAVLLVPGWRESSGTLAEVDHANTLGIPVYERLAELLAAARLAAQDSPESQIAPQLAVV